MKHKKSEMVPRHYRKSGAGGDFTMKAMDLELTKKSGSMAAPPIEGLGGFSSFVPENKEQNKGGLRIPLPKSPEKEDPRTVVFQSLILAI